MCHAGFFCSEIEVFREEKGHKIILYIRFETAETGKRQIKYRR